MPAIAINVKNHAFTLLESQLQSDHRATRSENGELGLWHVYLPKPPAAKPPEGLHYFPRKAECDSLRSGFLRLVKIFPVARANPEVSPSLLQALTLSQAP